VVKTIHQISNSREVIMAEQKCPVCDWEIKDGGVKVTVGGKELTVCCDDCAKDAIAKHEKAAAA
jgi:ribosome-binding protein aMBF1 (putative translation factor)